MAYTVEIISMEQKEELVDQYRSGILYEIKSDIYGCCIKLLTGVQPSRQPGKRASIPHLRAFDPMDVFMCCRTSPWEKTWFIMTLNQRQGFCSIWIITAG